MIIETLCIGLVTIVLWQWWKMTKESREINVPGPIPLPVLGNGHLLIVKPTEFLNVLDELLNKYGNTVRLHLLSKQYVITRQAKVIEEIVTNNELGTKGSSYKFLEPFLGEGLLTSTGTRWKNHRKFLTPAFHFNILQNFLPIFVKNEKILVKKLQTVANGEPVDLFPVMTLAALDNVIESIMGVEINAQQQSTESTYVKNIEIVSSISAERMRNILLAPEFLFNLSSYGAQQKKALEYLHEFTRSVIQKRQQELNAKNVTQLEEQQDIGTKNNCAFLDLLLLAETNGKKIPNEWIREEVDTFLFEGHDTTSSGLVYTLFCIAHHPDVQEKIVDEQNIIFQDDPTRDVTYSDLKQMKYLGLVIKEALRLHPSVPLIERLITEDRNIAGYNLPKGTSIILDIYHLQRQAVHFEDPLAFKPERFEDEKGQNAFAWLAFSAGSRNCIGQKFAIMEMKVIIAAVVRNFVLSPAEKNLDFTCNLILKSPNGVHVKIEPRNK